MGADKALLPYRGRTFLDHIIHTLREAGVDRIAVVLGHHAAEIQRASNLKSVKVIVNGDYQRGQTSSLQAGLQALEGENLRAVVLCLIDHPAVTPEVVKNLVASFDKSRAPVVIPTHRGERGHPVLINRDLFKELLSLTPDQGANTVIRKYRSATQFVEVADPGILLDVDDPETFRKLEKP